MCGIIEIKKVSLTCDPSACLQSTVHCEVGRSLWGRLDALECVLKWTKIEILRSTVPSSRIVWKSRLWWSDNEMITSESIWCDQDNQKSSFKHYPGPRHCEMMSESFQILHNSKARISGKWHTVCLKLPFWFNTLINIQQTLITLTANIELTHIHYKHQRGQTDTVGATELLINRVEKNLV